MNPSIDISALPGPAQKILDPNGPPPLRAMAAKGVVPGLKPGDIVTVVALLAEFRDSAIAQTAGQTFANLPAPILQGALSADLHPGVIDSLATAYLKNDEVIGRLLEMPSITPDTVVRLASKGSEHVTERIATNESRLLAHPAIIEALYMNKATRMSTADRVLELAVRNHIELNIPAFKEAATAIQDELIAEPSEEPTFDDQLYSETESIAESIARDLVPEDTHVVDDEGNEEVAEKAKPLWVQLANMTISQKIRRAILGTSAERMLLVRDTNRLVAAAAVRSPLMQENEITLISSSRSVDQDVLRIIANSKEWSRSYQIKLNLVTNPRTPFHYAAKLIPLLRESDLKNLAKSKNVTGSVATACKQHLLRRGPRQH